MTGLGCRWSKRRCGAARVSKRMAPPGRGKPNWAASTQTSTDAQGFAVRDEDSTSFVGAIETAAQFGWRIYAEAVRRGYWQAAKVVVLGDGAEWIRNLAETHFHGAIQIVDLYHARQHVAELCKLLFAGNDKEIVRHRLRWWTMLDASQVEKIVAQARNK